MRHQNCCQRPICQPEDPNSQFDHRLTILLDRIALKDEAAFAELYSLLHRKIFGYARNLISDASQAEEVVSDVFRYVWMGAKNFNPTRASAFAWMLMLTRSRAIDHIRRGKRFPLNLREGIDAAQLASPAESAEQRLLRICRERRVLTILEDLQPGEKQLLRLAFYEGRTHKEISDLTGIPLGTVKTRIRCGLQKMRANWQERPTYTSSPA